MSLITENPTNLQTLPYDVIRSIIRVGQESIEGIRMVNNVFCNVMFNFKHKNTRILRSRTHGIRLRLIILKTGNVFRLLNYLVGVSTL